jgi:type III secretion protein T
VSWSSELSAQLPLLMPHVIAIALCAARLLPVAFLCPLFGGSSLPMTVKLALVLSLGCFLHFTCGIGQDLVVTNAVEIGAVFFKEIVFGTVLGLVAALPFDAARIGGRFIDLFRGSSAEASLPYAGNKESAAADGLYQLLVAISACGIAMPIVLSALFKSFSLVKLGGYVATESSVMFVVSLAGTGLAVGLAVGAPVAGIAMAVDALMGLVSRAVPQLNLQDSGAPLKLLAGSAVLWLAVGVICERLLAGVIDTESAIHTLAALSHG